LRIFREFSPERYQRLCARGGGYRTPNIDRIAREGMMFIGLLRREQLHCGAVVVQSRVAGIGPQIG